MRAAHDATRAGTERGTAAAVLERVSLSLNREGFTRVWFCDSSLPLVREASMNDQALFK
jgi:hypothetical protein